jgi:hypothetical protein
VDIDAYESEALLRMKIATLNINNVKKRLANLFGYAEPNLTLPACRS